MSSLYRTLAKVKEHAFEQVKISLRQGGCSEILPKFDVVVDPDRYPSEKVKLVIEFMGKPLWQRLIPVKDLHSDSSHPSDKALRESVTSTMAAHLNLVAQMHYAMLDRYFPNSIDEVVMDVQAGEKFIIVKFKNGHVADGPEAEVKSEFFLAKCTMLHDLPYL